MPGGDRAHAVPGRKQEEIGEPADAPNVRRRAGLRREHKARAPGAGVVVETACTTLESGGDVMNDRGGAFFLGLLVGGVLVAVVFAWPQAQHVRPKPPAPMRSNNDSRSKTVM